jgi:hypothetical protein
MDEKLQYVKLIFILLKILIFILKSTINFEGDKWIHTSVDKSGKKAVVTRYIDSNGQHMIVSLSLDFSMFL